eukprot:7069948-Pyramimonas_sp.AAC.1
MGPRSAAVGTGTACEHRQWGLRWSSLWGHKTLPWPEEPRANCATAAFGGAPYGAAKHCPGRGNRMREQPLRPS